MTSQIARNVAANLRGESSNIEPSVLNLIVYTALNTGRTVEQTVDGLFPEDTIPAPSDSEQDRVRRAYNEFFGNFSSKTEEKQEEQEEAPSEAAKARAIEVSYEVAEVLGRAMDRGMKIPDGSFDLKLDPKTGELTQEAATIVNAIINGDYSVINRFSDDMGKAQPDLSEQCDDPECPCHDEDDFRASPEAQKAAYNEVEDPFINWLLGLNMEEEQLPEWAECKASERHLERMTQLCTKDGRRTGNGVIFDIVFDYLSGEAQFWIITDARNIIKLTFKEVMELFHEPTLVMNDYPNNDDGTVDELIEDFYYELRN